MLQSIRKICVVGVGGVGGYLGGKLVLGNLEPGTEIYFIARGAHLAEIRRQGLILNSGNQKGLVCKPTLATDRISDIPSPDLCLVCVKGYDLAEVCEQLRQVVQPRTVLIPLLNGVDIYQRMRAVLNQGTILPACIYVGTHIEKPGVVTQEGGDARILFGPDPQHPEYKPQEIFRLLGRSGIQYQWFENPLVPIWEKYLFIASFGLVTGVSGKTLGGVIDDPVLYSQVRGIMGEIFALGEKEGINWPAGAIDATLARAGRFPPEAKTSFQRDLEQAGHKHEGELFGGTIIRLGQEWGVPTPVTREVYEEILRRGQ